MQAGRVSATAQLRMMAAIQPFLSGGIAHTVTLDHNASLEVVRELIFEAWSLGLKSLSIYREGCAMYLDQDIPLEASHEEDELMHQPGIGYTESIAPISLVKH